MLNSAESHPTFPRKNIKARSSHAGRTIKRGFPRARETTPNNAASRTVVASPNLFNVWSGGRAGLLSWP